MLRTSIKRELLHLLNTMIELHHKGLLNYNPNKMFSVLQDCQSAAITVGEYMEKSMENAEPYISILENYCETIYQLTERKSVSREIVSGLDKMIYDAIGFIKSAESKYQVVFFPYKASMWDSLESIWKASNDDAGCECLVVPIPYFQFDNREKTAHLCYEGDDFPPYVPVTNYKDYNLEKERPDIVYIHNPYDNHNYVTSVHPDYYSHNLKKYVNKLVYVPYYVSAGFVSETQKCVPVYNQMDYMIAQSENFKKGFKGLPYWNKILPLGSPKFDRVIRMCKGNKNIPEEWTRIIHNRKTVMLNTSINCFLNNGNIMIDKLRMLFDIFKAREDVVLIWRPHPLIKATIASMRPQLSERYYDLENFFISNKVGILDHTSDVTNTIAIADAYIGESASSVVHLFGAAGKPIFILDNYISEEFCEEQKRAITVADMIELDGKMWLVSLRCNGLFSMEEEAWDKLHFCGRVDKGAKWTCGSTKLLSDNGKIFLAAYDVTSINVFDIEQNGFIPISKEKNDNICAIGMTKYGNKIFYILQYKDEILEYNLGKTQWRSHEKIFAGLKAEANGCAYNVWDYSVYNEYIWTTTNYSNKILQFNMRNGQTKILQIGDTSRMYSGIVCDSENIYLAESHTGEVICVNRNNGKQVVYKMPKNFDVYSDGVNKVTAHRQLLDMGELIVTIPHNGNCMVIINKRSGESHLLVPDFWKPVTDMANGYDPRQGASYFAKVMDEKHIVVQRLNDNAIAQIDIGTEKYEIYYPRMSEESYIKFMDAQDGFEKVDIQDGFCCKESRFFSVTNFLNQLANGKLDNLREKQIESLSSMAANLDGTCGEKVHMLMMKKMEET